MDEFGDVDGPSEIPLRRANSTMITASNQY